MRYVGQSLPRREDDRLLRGAGRFVDDLDAGPACHEVAFLRSDQAHARVVRVDASLARHMPGVVAIFTALDIADELAPMVFDIARMVPDSIRNACDIESRVHPMPALAQDRVTYVGQPIAMVVADSRYRAEDALELIEVDLDPLPAVVDPLQALEDVDVLVEPSWLDNVGLRAEIDKGDVETAFASADVVVAEEFRSHRYIASPLETRGVVASAPDPGGTLSVWSSTQVPHQLRDFLAGALNRPADSLRVSAPDVGGGFGVKGSIYPEDLLIPFAALKLNASVKWIEDRSEHFAATTHGREQVHFIELAADSRGRVLGVRDRIVHNCGAFHTLGLVVPYNSVTHLLGPYDIPNAHISLRAVLTNTGVVAPYRGAGRPEAVFAMERAMDRLARAVGIEPVEVRARNLIPAIAMPYDTGLIYRDGLAQVYDSGDYPELLRQVHALVDDQHWRAQGSQRYRYGIGYAIYIEGTGVGPFESADLRLESTGRITVATGAASQGQGHATSFAQIAADSLGVPVDSIDVRGADSSLSDSGFGTIASRSLVVAGNAAALAATDLRRRILDIAGDMLEVDAADLTVVDGRIEVRGVPGARLTVSELAASLSPYNPARPAGAPVIVRSSATYRPGPVTYAAGAHAAVVRVDVSTGHVGVVRYCVAHDAGVIVNPAIAEGQIVGGVMQGLGGALFEALRYDEGGQLLTGSFLDYLLPTADVMPEFRIAHVDTPTPLNALGVKGLGEGGAIGPPAAVANAVEDALQGFGAVIRSCPVTPDAVRNVVRDSVDRIQEAQ